MSLGLLEILAMLLPVLALGGLLGRLSQKAKLKELDDKAFRNHTALQEQRLAAALSLLLAWQTPSLYAASPPPAAPELKLNPSDQGRLAEYIRQCEIDREISDARGVALRDCRGPESVADVLSHTLIMSVLLSLVLGYTAGRMDR